MEQGRKKVCSRANHEAGKEGIFYFYNCSTAAQLSFYNLVILKCLLLGKSASPSSFAYLPPCLSSFRICSPAPLPTYIQAFFYLPHTFIHSGFAHLPPYFLIFRLCSPAPLPSNNNAFLICPLPSYIYALLICPLSF